MPKQSFKEWLDTRLGLEEVLNFLQKKEVPRHKHTLWYYTGSAILVFLVIQIITGFMLLLYYKPTLEEAYQSVERIMTEVSFGWVIRSLHHWSATLMIAFVFIHLLSLWILKAYRSPRELTWMSGVVLLFLTLAFGFTGYLLPWDELSLAATKVGTEIPSALPLIGRWLTQLLRGGADVTGDTLTRFFGLHVSILPLALILVLGLHLYLVQKHGMSVPLSEERQNRPLPSYPFWPNFLLRESVFWLILLGGLISLSLFLPRGLGQPADLMAPAPAGVRPEWYFLFLFQTLKLFPATILGIPGDTIAVLLIMVGVGLFFFLPLLDTDPAGRRGKVITGAAVVFIIYAVVMSVWSLL